VASERKSPPAAQAEAKARTAAQEQASSAETAAAPAMAPAASPASAAEGTSPALVAQATPAPEQNRASNPDKKETPQAGAQNTPGAGGLVIFIDPVTKQIRQPEPGEMQQLLGPETQKVVGGAPLVRKTLAGGGVGVVLDSSFDSYTVVTKQPDGKLSMGCVTGERKAEELVSTGAPVSETVETQEAHDVK
jgi:hypothetical protein